MAGEAKARRSLPVRLARGLAWTLIVLVGAVALILLLAQLALRTSYVEEKLASFADEQAKKALAGRLKMGKIELRGALDLCVRNVDLEDPDGVPAIRAKSICVSLDAMALLHKGIHLRRIALDTPAVFLTTEAGANGATTSSLERALAPRVPSPAVPTTEPAPFAWAISADAVTIHNGSFEMRDAPGAQPMLAVHALELGDTTARYAQSGAAAKLSLSGGLAMAGEAKVQVALDAQLDGAVPGGKLTLRSLDARLGASGFKADGNVDLSTLAGALHVHELLLEPPDLEQLLGPLPLAAELRGEAEVTSDGKTARAAIHVQTVRGGLIDLAAQSTLEESPRWSAKLETEHVDPAFVVRGAPAGKVSLGLTLEGKGIPKIDESGLAGDVRGALHLGPAALKATGPLSADAEFSLSGKSALVKKLDADALAIHVRANGAASLRELALDLQIDATDLGKFSRALGALEHKPPTALTGSAKLSAHLTGSPERPNAQLHLRSPALALGAGLRVTGLAIDGSLNGALKRPHGTLTVGSTSMQLGSIGLGAPKIEAEVDWPQAHLQIDAAVGGSSSDQKQEQGTIHLAGDAQVDEDGDGAELTGFEITWPGNALLQDRLTRLHFRATETVLEPLVLKGARGDLSLAATVHPPPPPLAHKEPGPTRVEAQLALEKFELGGLPAFALPAALHLGGSIDAEIAMSGTTAAPEIKGKLALHSVEIATVRGLDGELTAEVEHDRVRAEAKLRGIAGATLNLRANVPIEKSAPDSAPLELDLAIGPIDLSMLPALLQRQELFLAKPAGLVNLHLLAKGTMASPRAEAIIDATGVAWGRFHNLGLRADLIADDGKATLASQLSLEKTPAATLSATAPFDLTATLRKPALFAHVFEKPASAKLRIADLHLELLSQVGVLPPGASGELVADLELGGTAADPQLSLTATGKKLTAGPVSNLDLALHLSAAQRLHLDVTAKPGGDAQAKVALSAQISAPELVAVLRKGFSKETLEPLFDRALSLDIDLENLVLGSLAARGTAAQLPVRGDLNGRISGSGTADAPVLKGNLVLRDIEAGVHQLGDAEIYVEADKNGALAHVGLAPPSAQELQARQAELEKRSADEAAAARAAAKAAKENPDGGVPTPAAQASTAVTVKGDAAADGGAPLPEAGKPERQTKEQELQDHTDQLVARAKSGMSQRGGGTFLGHATLQAPLSARVLMEQGFDAIEEGSLDGSVTMRNLDLTFLSGLTPLLRSTGGVIDGDIELRGLLDRPKPDGEAHLRNGRFDVVGQGIFDDVSLDATLTEHEIVIDRVSGSTGGGTFSGTLVLDRHDATGDDEDDQYQFSGELHAGDADSVADRKGPDGKPLIARPVPLRQAGEVRADLAAEVDFFGDDTAGNVTATVKIPNAKVRVASLPDKKLPSLSPNPEVFVFKKGEAPHPAGIDTAELKRQKEAMAQTNLRVDLRLELEKLDVSANDFEFPVTSKMHATWDAQHPNEAAADGTVEVSSGTFSALGRRFSIDEAKITETGGDITDPELEIQARYENAQASVLVLVSGTAKDPQIDLSSSPPMDQDAIAFFLATGRLQGQATQQGSGVDLGSAATSVLGAMLFGKLRSSMADIMPVDVVDIEAGGGDRPPEASVGKYIGDRIFVGYRQRFSPAPTENENEFSVEYEILRGLGTTGTVGEKNQGVMVTYTKDF